MFHADNHAPEIVGTNCAGCDLKLAVNDLGLCDDCYAKLERDLIRSREWAYSGMAFGVAPEDYEALRQQIIHDYGAPYELLTPPRKTAKNKRSHTRTTQRKREIATQAIRNYTTEDVLASARQLLETQDAAWVNAPLRDLL
jgi:hypothetical protein